MTSRSITAAEADLMARCSVQGKPRNSSEVLILDRVASQLRFLGMGGVDVVEVMADIHRRLGLHYKAPHTHVPEPTP